jgi:putative membrane protein
MKKYLRILLVNLGSLWLVAYLLPGVTYSGGTKTLLWAALVLTLVNLFLKPLIKLLLLPVNLITLGSFRWLINVLSLYLVTLIVPAFDIVGFHFSGFTYKGFAVPAVDFNYFWALVVTSFILSLSSTTLLWLSN